MESVTLDYAREHLDELLRRAQQGEEVEIADPVLGKVRLQPVATAAPRRRRVPGQWKERLPPPPDDFFDPLSEEELKHWYGDDA